MPETHPVPVLHTVGVGDAEAVEQPEEDRVAVMQDEGVRVLQELADWESVSVEVSVPVPHAVELRVLLELAE